jgi:hypothetical protein
MVRRLCVRRGPKGMAQMIKYFGRGLAAALLVVVGSTAFGISNSTSYIGSAQMTRNGTIQLRLRAPLPPVTRQGPELIVPSSPPGEIIGYGEVEVQPGDLYYGELLRHLGGLRPGETKSVPDWRADEKWHCALDPHRGPCPLTHLLPGT